MTDQTNEPPVSPTAKSRGGWPLMWVALLLALAAPVAYVVLMDNPFQRSTGAATFALVAIAAVGGLVGAMRRRSVMGWIVGGAPSVLLVFAVVAFTTLAKLPPGAEAMGIGAAAPDFTLTDQTGRPVELARELQSGPMLLVFYRGHW
ncbi:MAG: redoxin domain-containing protein [Phycisphaerales bacterium]|nr:redoxin domain-containing protein [Phycisphaerales bacterium]